MSVTKPGEDRLKLYRCTYLGVPVSWNVSEDDAERKARKLREQIGPSATLLVEMVDVPIDGPGLVDWLNRNFSRENG